MGKGREGGRDVSFVVFRIFKPPLYFSYALPLSFPPPLPTWSLGQITANILGEAASHSDVVRKAIVDNKGISVLLRICEQSLNEPAVSATSTTFHLNPL